MMKNNQQGRSMIEMLGVLSIVGVLSVSGIVLYSKALHQNKINTTIDQISQIIYNMRNAYRNRTEYSFNTKNLTQANDKRKIIPESMWVDGTIKTALGNKVTVTSNEGEKSFTIVLNRITTNDAKQCARIVTADWDDKVTIRLAAKYTTEMTGESPAAYDGGSSPAAALTFCQKVDDTRGVTSGFEFYVK